MSFYLWEKKERKGKERADFEEKRGKKRKSDSFYCVNWVVCVLFTNYSQVKAFYWSLVLIIRNVFFLNKS